MEVLGGWVDPTRFSVYSSRMDTLLELLRTHAFRRGEVKLSSGKTSDFFVDCKQAVLRTEGHLLVGAALSEAVERVPPPVDAVAGVVLGGCSLASSVAMHTALHGRGLDAIYVRKAEKEHGTRRRLEGSASLAPGSRLVIVEDVVTTGGSTLRAVAAIREESFDVAGVIAIVDRLEGGRQAIEAAGLHFQALYTRHDFMED